MGARGPLPTPTEVLRLRGSPRANLNRAEPKPPPEPPTKPDWLNEEAGTVWDQLVPMLQEMKVLSKIDAGALTRYCVMWAQWRSAVQFVDRHGTTYPIKDGNGKVKAFGQYPAVGMVHKLSLVLSRLEAEFGMTPSARTRINVPIQSERDEGHNDYFACG